MKKAFIFLVVFLIVAGGVFGQDRNNFGIWKIENAIDEFGDPTGDRYVTTINMINGLYSDAANSNSAMRITIKVIKRGKFNNILVTPYLRKNNVQGIPFASYREYRVAIRDKDGETFRTVLHYSRDSNSFDFYNVLQQNFTILHNALSKGGTVKVRIETDEQEQNHESYSFDIINADRYIDAYNKLMSD